MVRAKRTVSTGGEKPQSDTNKKSTRSSDEVKKSRRVSSEFNRTKGARRSTAVKDLQQQSPSASVRRSARLKDAVVKSEAEPCHYRCSENIFREIVQYQNSTELLIPKKPHERVVRESAQKIKPNIRFNPVTFVCLQEMSEAYLTDRFNKKDMLASHSKRVTIR